MLDVGDGGSWRSVPLVPTGPPEAPYRTGTWSYSWNEQINDYDNSGGVVNTNRTIRLYAEDLATNTSAIPCASVARLVDNCYPQVTGLTAVNNNSPSPDFLDFTVLCPQTSNPESNLIITAWEFSDATGTNYATLNPGNSPVHFDVGNGSQNASGDISVRVQDQAGNAVIHEIQINEPPTLTINSVTQSGQQIVVNFDIHDSDAATDDTHINLTGLEFSLDEEPVTWGAALTHGTRRPLTTTEITAGAYQNLSTGSGLTFTWNATAQAWNDGLDGRKGHVAIYANVTDGKHGSSGSGTSAAVIDFDMVEPNITSMPGGPIWVNPNQTGSLDIAVTGGETGDGIYYWWTRAGTPSTPTPSETATPTDRIPSPTRAISRAPSTT